MWKQLPADKINEKAWDNCVEQDPEGLVYALTWYLHAVSPGWIGWVYVVNDSYQAVIPLAIRQVASLPVITQPLLTQQFGLFTSQPHLRSFYWAEVVFLIFQAKFPVEQYSFRKVDHNLVHKTIPLQERINYTLSLTKDYKLLKSNYNNNRIRDLKKATQAELHLQTGLKVWPHVFALYRQHVLPRLPKKQQAILLHIIPRLVQAATHFGYYKIYAVSLPNEQVVAGAFFLHYKNRLTYLLPVSSELGKKVGANTYLLDQVCQRYAGTNNILDFEGSSIPGISRFFISFGTQPEKYGLLEAYNFSVHLKLLFNVKKIIQRFLFLSNYQPLLL